MTKNVVIVSGVEQSDSVIHMHVSILFQVLFPFRLLHNIEQSSLCYIVEVLVGYPFYFISFNIYLFIYLFIWLRWVLVAAGGPLSCGSSAP